MRQIVVLILLLLLTKGGLCAPSAQDLRKIQSQQQHERQIQSQLQEKAQSVAQQVSSVQQQMVKTANQIQNNEEVLTNLEHKLEELNEGKKQLEQLLFARENQMIVLMSGLQKMAFYPPESVFFAPQNPVDNLRSSLILKSTKPPRRG